MLWNVIIQEQPENTIGLKKKCYDCGTNTIKTVAKTLKSDENCWLLHEFNLLVSEKKMYNDVYANSINHKT
uniref:Uncharacterized protein n=1 Tax=Onchocerca volvulus TaxID=6282 RepID=A0A8R1Y111_ONCVO